MMNPRVAIIIPWFGKELKGGAEQQAWQLATRLAQRGMHIAVLTTCSKDFLSDWSSNYYQEGSTEETFEIRRFPVKKQDRSLFDQVNEKLMSFGVNGLIPGMSPLNQAEELVYLNESIHSPGLIHYLETNRSEYDAFIFLPYLFPSTIRGVSITKDRSILVPCLHNESYAYLNCTGETFRSAGKIFFNSDGERELAETIIGAGIRDKSLVAGEGVEIDADRLREYDKPRKIKDEYILYLGKRDIGKNTHLLIQAFDAYVQSHRTGLRLVLAGPAPLPIDAKSKQVVDMGVVSDDDKLNLLKYCRALINPSENESFSRVIFEAWFAGKPVIVHRNCLATYRALEASGFAGWSADSQVTFEKIFEEVEAASSSKLVDMGRKGYEYAFRMAHWDAILDRYCKEIRATSLVAPESEFPDAPVQTLQPSGPAKPSVLIMYAQIREGDAVGNDVLQEYTALQQNGFPVYLYAETCDTNIDVKMIRKSEMPGFTGDPDTIIIYHHANYWRQGEEIIRQAKARVLMRYNSVTPPDFYRNYNASLADACAQGRQQTKTLMASGVFSGFIASSPYTADELRELGAPHEKIHVLAPFHIIEQFNGLPINNHVLRKFIGDKVNVLFVGRIAPNKGIEHLIETVRTYVGYYGRDISLHIVGGVNRRLIRYYLALKRLVCKYRLSDVIHFTRRVSFTDLHTFYSASDVFLLMSEHEGFCVTILEAQFHRLPVVALDRSAVKGTLGADQLLFSEIDYASFACAIHEVWKNRPIRMYLSEAGLKNYRKYDTKTLSSQLVDIVTREAQRRIGSSEA